MRLSNREKIAAARRKSTAPIEMDFEGFLKLMLAGDKPERYRVINPTQYACIMDKTRFKGYMGPAGCAKTSTIVVKAMMRALMEPGSSILIARADYNDLKGTTRKRAEEMLNRLPSGTLLDRSKAIPEEWTIKPIPQWKVNEDGSRELVETESKILFMGLKDDPGSLEFNEIIIDEANEVDKSILDQLKARLRHTQGFFYDREAEELAIKEGRETGYYQLSMAFNPPDKTHHLYEGATGLMANGRKSDQSAWYKLYVPNPKENVENLPPGYYESLNASLPEDKRRRLVEGQWGSVFPGKPVFRQYRELMHTRMSIPYEQGATLFRFWDFGYNHPVCLWAICSQQGHIRVLAEHQGTHVAIEAFIQQVKLRQAELFPDAETCADYGDIAAKQQKDTGSTLAVLHKNGIKLMFEKISIERSIDLIRTLLEKSPEGEPAILVDRTKAPILNDALRGGYHLMDDGVTPKKDGYYDHSADAFRYGVWGLLAAKNMMNGGTPTSVAYDPRKDEFR